MKSNKRGITPLMVTFLLVSLAVAVGVGIMNFGRAQVEEGAECAIDVNMKFLVVGGEEKLCYDAAAKELRFTLENGVNIAVDGLVMNVVGSSGAKSFEAPEAAMPKAGTYVGKIVYDDSVNGVIEQVKFVPVVTMYDEEVVCPEKALVVEGVKEC